MHRSFLLKLRQKNWKRAAERIGFSLFSAFLLCIPCFNGTMVNRGQKVQVLNRIGVLAEAMKNGTALRMIAFSQNFGYGYGSTLFETNTAYYLPAYLHSHGMDLLKSFRVTVFLLFAGLIYASILMASAVLKKGRLTTPLTALLASSALCTYTALFNDGMLEDISALIFLPVIITCLCRIVSKNGRTWLLLSVSIVLAYLCSPLYGVVYMMIAVLILLLHFRVLLARPRTLVRILAGVIVVSVFVLAQLIPRTVLLSRGDYVLNHISALSSRGVTLHDLFDVIPFAFDHMGKTPGLILLFFPWMIFRVKGKLRRRFAAECTAIGYALLFLSTTMFPWSLLPGGVRIIDPARLLPASAVLLAVGAGFVFSEYPFPGKDRLNVRMAFAGITAALLVLMIFTQYRYEGGIKDSYTGSELTSDSIIYGNTNSLANRTETGEGWYLPNTKTGWRNTKRTVKRDGKTLSFVENSGVILADTDRAGTFLFPRIWYPGYQLAVIENGKVKEVLDTDMDPETGLVRAVVEDVSEAKLELRYERPGILQAGEIISVIGWILLFSGIIGFYLFRTYGGNKHA